MKLDKRKVLLLIFLVVYSCSVMLSAGKLPNQTAGMLDIHGSSLQSLALNPNSSRTEIPLNAEEWTISGENAAADNFDGRLVISGNYTSDNLYFNRTRPLFVAEKVGLELNFAGNPYLQIVMSSQPDTETSFYLGWYPSNNSVVESFRERHPEVIVEINKMSSIAWVNMSWFNGGASTDERKSQITLNVAEELTKLDLNAQQFIGLQIRQYLIGFLPFDLQFRTTIESIVLAKEQPYSVVDTAGIGQAIEDGSTIQIIRKRDVANNFEEWPNLQRAYILYTIDAPKDTFYTIFLITKTNENLTAVRSGFVFVHQDMLDEIGTYVDWRKPILLNSNFEPVRTLYNAMSNGDYAIVFTPIRNDEIQSTRVNKVVLTFSKLPYSTFVKTDLNENVASAMSISILAIAGVIPTILMTTLYYLNKKGALRDNKITIRNLLLVGLGLRLVLAPISAHADDTQIFSEIGSLYFSSGVLGAQWVSLPGFAYLETAAYFPYALIRALGFSDFQFLALDVYCVELLFTKMAAILSDFGSFYFILKIADRFSPKNRVFIAGLYLLNPLTVYVSGILGQFDSIFTFTLIAFTYYLIVNYDFSKASLFSGLASVLNPVGMATVIPLLSINLMRRRWKNALKSSLIVIGIFSIVIAPFFFEPNSPVLLASKERLIGGVPGEGFYGKQMTFYTYGAITSSSIGYGLTFRFLLELLGFEVGWWYYPFAAVVVFLVFLTVFLYKTYKTLKLNLQDPVTFGTFMLGVVCLFQLTFPTVFEQFVIWVAGLLLVSYILHQDKRIIVLFSLTCISAGFIYVATWRTYLLLVSGVEAVQLGNPWFTNLVNALLGVAYSAVVATAFIVTCELWFKKERPTKSKSDQH